MRYIICVILLVMISLAACKQETAAPPSVQHTAPATMQEPAGDDAESDDRQSHELSGTAWQLVEIQSMDDSVIAPDDPTRYTLAFGDDGTVAIQADCNRGTGSWVSESPSQLEFGPVATTMAMCPPESVSGPYLKQFEWVRSYVLKDGHLFLATMADGSIIEFSPLP